MGDYNGVVAFSILLITNIALLLIHRFLLSYIDTYLSGGASEYAWNVPYIF